MPALKSAKSKTWFVRIDGEEEYLRPKVTQLAECVDVVDLLCAFHTGTRKENPHVHMVITMLGEVQKQSYALRIKRVFEVVDRSYALDVWDARRAVYGAVSYLFHEEGAPIICKKGWTTDEIAEAQRIAATANTAIAESKDRASTKLVDKAIKHFEAIKFLDENHTVPTKLEITKFMFEAVHKGEAYYPGEFKMKQYIEEVQIKTTDNLNNLIYYFYQRNFDK